MNTLKCRFTFSYIKNIFSKKKPITSELWDSTQKRLKLVMTTTPFHTVTFGIEFDCPKNHALHWRLYQFNKAYLLKQDETFEVSYDVILKSPLYHSEDDTLSLDITFDFLCTKQPPKIMRHFEHLKQKRIERVKENVYAVTYQFQFERIREFFNLTKPFTILTPNMLENVTSVTGQIQGLIKTAPFEPITIGIRHKDTMLPPYVKWTMDHLKSFDETDEFTKIANQHELKRAFETISITHEAFLNSRNYNAKQNTLTVKWKLLFFNTEYYFNTIKLHD